MRPLFPFLLLCMLGLSACATRHAGSDEAGYVGGTIAAECAPFAAP